MTEIQTSPKQAASLAQAKAPGSSPDPSVALVEFGEDLGILLAARTERDTVNRRLVLKKVAYLRIGPQGWGATALPEVWIHQNESGICMAIEPRTGKVFRHPSRLRYEVVFLSPEIFECAVQCLKQQRVEPVYDLIVVAFSSRDGFSVENKGLVGPEGYADERELAGEDQWMPTPSNAEP